MNALIVYGSQYGTTRRYAEKFSQMMKFLYNKAKKLPAEKQTAEVKTMIETYNTKVDFVDFDSLNQIRIK